MATLDVISTFGSIFRDLSKSPDQWKTIDDSLSIFKMFDAFCLIVFDKLLP